MCPAKSKAQQQFMGIVHGIQKGEIDPGDVSPEAKTVAKSIKKKDAKDFASTKHKGLPDKIKESMNSTTYGYTKNGTVQYKGSKKLALSKMKTDRKNSPNIKFQLINSPKAKVGDKINESKIPSSYKPNANNTGTVGIGEKDFMIYTTNSGKFYSEFSPEQYKDYSANKDKQGVRYQLLSKAVDEKTFRKKNPTKKGYAAANDRGGYIMDHKLKEIRRGAKMKKRLVEHFYTAGEIRAVNERIFDDEPKKIPREVRERAFAAIKEYNKYSKIVHTEGNLIDVAKTLSEIAEFASRYTVEEAGDWFDAVTIKRNMNELKKMSAEFNKVATEVQKHRDRMGALYEDMGNVLNRYFKIDDIIDEPKPTSTDTQMRNGDRATVNIKDVRKHNPTPSYMNKVKSEIKLGHGSVKIQEINKNTVIVSGADFALSEVEIPKTALSKLIPGQWINEAVLFDEKKIRAMAKTDKFLKSQLKLMSPEKVFFHYIKGDSEEEKKYNKVKTIKESPIFQTMNKRKKK